MAAPGKLTYIPSGTGRDEPSGGPSAAAELDKLTYVPSGTGHDEPSGGPSAAAKLEEDNKNDSDELEEDNENDSDDDIDFETVGNVMIFSGGRPDGLDFHVVSGGSAASTIITYRTPAASS